MYEISEIEEIEKIREEINDLITHLINNKINTILNNYNNIKLDDIIEYIILLRFKYLLYKL